MASSKKYAYYLRGSQLALIEENTGLGSGTCSLSDYKNKVACEAAGGTWTANSTSGRDLGQYKSPQTDSTDGLEIEYCYSPRYSFIAGGDQTGASRHWRPLGVTGASGSRLTFLVPNEDFSSTFTVGDKILVKGSNRWNGVHTVADSSKLGAVITETAYSSGGAGNSSIDVSCDFTAGDKTIIGNGLLQKQEIGVLFPEGTHYVFVGITEAAVDTQNNSEIFKVTSNGSGTLTATAQYTITSGAVTESTSPVLATRSADVVTLAKVHYDPFYLYPSAAFKLLEDESDTIDLPEYLAKALVYYVKGKLAEDQNQLDEMAYNMSQFRALMNRYENSRIYGSRRVAPGYGAIK